MPIEIEEVIIRAKVAAEEPSSDTGGLSPIEKIQLVQACVEEVLRILKTKKNP